MQLIQNGKQNLAKSLNMEGKGDKIIQIYATICLFDGKYTSYLNISCFKLQHFN